MATDPTIIAHGLCKGFGDRTVIKGADLEVQPGAALGLVGLNGAGKTTLLRLLLGLLKPDAGSVLILGHDPWTHAPELFRQLGVLLEHDGFEGNLSFRANIEFFARAKGVASGDLRRYLDEWWACTPIIKDGKPVKHFSRGQRMQCGLCRAFLGWPRVCLLDEPTVALDIDAYEQFCRLVREALSRGSTVVISSHVMETIEDLCDTAAVLSDGTLRSVIVKGALGAPETWSFGGAEDARYAAILQEVTGTTPRYETGKWQVTLRESAVTVPEVVRRLAVVGLDVRHVARVRMSLRSMLRRTS